MGFHPHHGASFMFASLEICPWQLWWSHATCSCHLFRLDADVLTRNKGIPWNHRKRGSCRYRIRLVSRPPIYFSMVNLRIHCRVFEIYGFKINSFACKIFMVTTLITIRVGHAWRMLPRATRSVHGFIVCTVWFSLKQNFKHRLNECSADFSRPGWASWVKDFHGS